MFSLPFAQKKGVFCSELVAKLYLDLKLTKSTKFNPATIYPGDLSGEKVESFLVPTLTFEHQIIFEKET